MPADVITNASMRSRASGRLAGLALLPLVIEAYDSDVALNLAKVDGAAVSPGDVVATLTGRLRNVLAIERVALNFVCHLSGIATLTGRFADVIAGTQAVITDTRKTIPAYRGLAKYAVVCGGGVSHRMGLHDAMLVKDNHIAHLPADQLATALTASYEQARRLNPSLAFIEVEVDTLAQLERVLPTGPDIVLLDNMGPDLLREAVAMRDRAAPDVKLEASGGVDLDTVRDVADAGVDRIAIGALTHSAPALDLGLDIPVRTG